MYNVLHHTTGTVIVHIYTHQVLYVVHTVHTVYITYILDTETGTGILCTVSTSQYTVFESLILQLEYKVQLLTFCM